MRNGSGEAAPAHALLQVTGTDADGTTIVGKPAADNLTLVLVNGPAEIPAGGRGVAIPADHVPALYNPAATPAVGQTWGTAANDWRLTSGKSGFVVSGAADATATRVAVMRSGVAGLATRNLDDTQIGTTTDMRFDQASGIRITQGASFDTVALMYGPAINIVTNVCPVRDTYGVMTGIQVERRSVTFPAGTTIGDRVCVTNPGNCCSPVLSCVGVVGAVAAPTFYLNFISKTGMATCLPDSVRLVHRTPYNNGVFVCGIGQASITYSPEGSSANFFNGNVDIWPHCGWTPSSLGAFGIRLGFGCADLLVPPCTPVGGGEFYVTANVNAPTDLVTNTNSPFSSVEFNHPLSVANLSANGTLNLGTVTRTAIPSSVTLVLSWEI